MPIYEYKCTKCEHVFEVQQKMSAEPIRVCPKCQGQVNKVFSAAGIVLKGSGFHNTDYDKYQHKNRSKEAKKESPPKKPQKKKPDNK